MSKCAFALAPALAHIRILVASPSAFTFITNVGMCVFCAQNRLIRTDIRIRSIEMISYMGMQRIDFVVSTDEKHSLWVYGVHTNAPCLLPIGRYARKPLLKTNCSTSPSSGGTDEFHCWSCWTCSSASFKEAYWSELGLSRQAEGNLCLSTSCTVCVLVNDGCCTFSGAGD